MKKNVLLLCLSPVKADAVMSEYSYTVSGGQPVNFTGYMTNEAPAKCVIDSICRDRNGKLDRVVMVCSSKLLSAIDTSSGCSIKALTDNPQMTHTDYYKWTVNNFASLTDPVYEDKNIEFAEIPVEDYTESNAVSLAAVSAAESILSVAEKGDSIDLYIDYNGGQRYFALMLLAVSNIMKQHSVNIQKVLTMNYENKLDGKVQIQNLSPILNCINLVSATNEYINYGKTAALQEYFAEACRQDKEINELISQLTEFAHSLLLCNVTEIEEMKNELYLKLKNYVENPHEETAVSPDLQALRTLFNFVAKDIFEEMKPLLTGSLPDMILWCKKHDYIQQALTFFNELLPFYLWKNNILKPTAAEESQYAAFKDKLAATQKETLPRDFSSFSPNCPKDSARYCYDWFTYYMRPAENGETNPFIAFMPQNNLLKIKPEVFKIEATFKDRNRPVLSEKCWGKKEPIVPFSRALKNTKTIIAFAFSGATKRAFSSRGNQRDLAELILVYFILKEQRNAANHASDAKNKISYENLSRLLENTAKFLKTL